MKDEEEIKTLIAAQRIAEKALQEALEFIKPGRTEKEISAFLQYRMLCHGADRMSFEPIVVSGVNSSMPHGVPSLKQVFGPAPGFSWTSMPRPWPKPWPKYSP